MNCSSPAAATLQASVWAGAPSQTADRPSAVIIVRLSTTGLAAAAPNRFIEFRTPLCSATSEMKRM
jgi:hypothetical protein